MGRIKWFASANRVQRLRANRKRVRVRQWRKSGHRLKLVMGRILPREKLRRPTGQTRWSGKMPKDACYKKVKARVKVFPSARASQQIAKCRKSKGQVKKSPAGSSLKRWGAEKWQDTRTGKPCGQGKVNEYCRPTKRVSSKTPKLKSEMSKSQLKRKKAEKSKVGMGRRVKPIRRKKWN